MMDDTPENNPPEDQPQDDAALEEAISGIDTTPAEDEPSREIADMDENAEDDDAPSGSQAVYLNAEEPDLETVFDIPVEVNVVLGETRMSISELLKLGSGNIIELERKVGEPVDVYVNKRLVARGEVVIVENHIGITMTEIIKVDKAKDV